MLVVSELIFKAIFLHTDHLYTIISLNMSNINESARPAPVMTQPEVRESEVKKEKRIINFDKARVHAAIMTGERPGKDKILDRAKLDAVRGSLIARNKPDVSVATNGSIYERLDHYENYKDETGRKVKLTEAQQMEIWMKEMNEIWLPQFKDRAKDKEILHKLGIETENGAAGLYDEYFSEAKGGGDLGYFAKKVVDNLSSDEIERHSILLTALGGIFGKDSAEVSKYIVEATNNMMVEDTAYEPYAKKAVDSFTELWGSDDHRIIHGIDKRAAKFEEVEKKKKQGSSTDEPKNSSQTEPGGNPGTGRGEISEEERRYQADNQLFVAIEQMKHEELAIGLTQLSKDITAGDNRVLKEFLPVVDYIAGGKDKLPQEEFDDNAVATLFTFKRVLNERDAARNLSSMIDLYNIAYAYANDPSRKQDNKYYAVGAEKIKYGLEKFGLKLFNVNKDDPIDPEKMDIQNGGRDAGNQNKVSAVVVPGFMTADDKVFRRAVVKTESGNGEVEFGIDGARQREIQEEVHNAMQHALTSQQFEEATRTNDAEKIRQSGPMVLNSLNELEYALLYSGVTDPERRKSALRDPEAKYNAIASHRAGLKPSYFLQMIRNEKDGKIMAGPSAEIVEFPGNTSPEERQRLNDEIDNSIRPQN